MCHRTNIDSPFIVVYTIKKDTNGSLENVIEIKLSIHTLQCIFGTPTIKMKGLQISFYIKSFHKNFSRVLQQI